MERISKWEVRAAMKRMKNGKADVSDDIPVEVRICINSLTRLFNTVL